ncbi:hypothetical protein WMY93_029676 [Mugilogobius chulae]|uniref:Dynein heavy chain tail domain-containing protein n=1 Tax=Mugilogobius chulae TaxID=88201 RepID=A0AAW0MKI7_9GOBI
MASTLENLSALEHIKVEGVEKIYSNYQTIVSSTKSKAYDVLDHRKLEFDSDFSDFQTQIQSLIRSLESLLDSWFEQAISVVKLLDLLSQFQSVSGLELKPFYLQILQKYHRELEQIRKTYQRQREDPPLGRNLPPFLFVSAAGLWRILWCRQLFSKMEAPMLLLKPRLDFLRGPELSRLVQFYNRTAVVLMQYELLHLQHWNQAAEGAPVLLRSSLLVRLQNQDLSVNLSPGVLEVLEEARWMKKMGLEVPTSVEKMSRRESHIRALKTRLLDLLQDFHSVLDQIPQALVPLLQTFISDVNSALSPGLTTLTWSSLNAQAFVDSVQRPLLQLKQVCKSVSDILDCRIGRLLQRISSTVLLILPETNPVTPEELLSSTERELNQTAAKLSW